MRDVIDRANDIAQLELDNLIAKRKVYTGKSSLYCCECGDPIPEARRDAVPGCSLCVYCQQILEAKGKHEI
jgi:phage/conjugal plasmid C-4 type zinc finger TraR family protein